MKIEYNQIPDFNDKNKWIELEARKKIKYDYIGAFLLPVTKIKFYREIKNKKIGLGLCITTTFFKQKNPLIINWRYSVSHNRKTFIEYTALLTKNRKWAISNPSVNGYSIVDKDIKILQIYFSNAEIWIIFKARKGWCLRKIKSHTQK
ncbi:hypothetical protein KJ671_01325 [Patescibacteria group bacterium]|nr:hypothetical protein [Patescibacteria group bacterium]